MRRTPPLLLISPLLFVISGCGRGVDATNDTVKTAEAKWKAANVRDYDLEWANSGLGTGHYKVFVRGGEVKAVYSVIPGGREVVAKPGAPRLYSVDGLFTIIRDEIAQLDQPSPFGQPKGTSTVLKFTPDPELGYPRSYRRDVLGTPKGVSIDVLRLDRNPPAVIPPPAGSTATDSR